MPSMIRKIMVSLLIFGLCLGMCAQAQAMQTKENGVKVLTF